MREADQAEQLAPHLIGSLYVVKEILKSLSSSYQRIALSCSGVQPQGLLTASSRHQGFQHAGGLHSHTLSISTDIAMTSASDSGRLLPIISTRTGRTREATFLRALVPEAVIKIINLEVLQTSAIPPHTFLSTAR